MFGIIFSIFVFLCLRIFLSFYTEIFFHFIAAKIYLANLFEWTEKALKNRKTRRRRYVFLARELDESSAQTIVWVKAKSYAKIYIKNWII